MCYALGVFYNVYLFIYMLNAVKSNLLHIKFSTLCANDF